MAGIRPILKKFLKDSQERFPLFLQRKYFKSVRLAPRERPAAGRCLISYSLQSAGMPPDHPVFDYHSGPWESSVVVNFFLKRGYAVDVIHYTNRRFVPKESYDVIFSLTPDLYRLVAFSPNPPESILKIWHMNLSSLKHTNRTELERIDALERRRPGALYAPKRQEPNERIENKALRLADACVLVGNERVLNTYPKEFHHKIARIMISASKLRFRKRPQHFVPPEREFVWYFGNGAVRKGLDITLEAFARNPQWKLNVIGLVGEERDFMKIYRRELLEAPNVSFHGYLNPSSEKFIEIIKKCFCFVAPTCTESISTAVATMMQAGLYPLVSRESGVELSEGAGIYFSELSVSEVERRAGQAFAMSDRELREQIEKTQRFALENYSREKFAEGMEAFLDRTLSDWEKKQNAVRAARHM